MSIRFTFEELFGAIAPAFQILPPRSPSMGPWICRGYTDECALSATGRLNVYPALNNKGESIGLIF